MTNEQNTPAPPDDALTERLRFTAKDARFHGYEGNAVLMEAAADAIAKMSLAISPAAGDADCDKGPWHVGVKGRDVFSDDFTVDAALRIEGDFEDDDHRLRYAEWLCARLNAAAPKPAAPPSVTDAGVDLCEVARELERVHVAHVIGEVAAIAGERTDPYWSGHSLACEEIAHRLELADALTHPGHKHAQEDAAQEVVPREGDAAFRGLWDSQWVNIVNHDNCYRDYTKEEAVDKAIKLTYAALRENNTPIDSEAK